MEINPEKRVRESDIMDSSRMTILGSVIAALCLIIVYLSGGFSKINQLNSPQDAVFEKLFNKYKIDPLPNGAYNRNGLIENLKTLLNEPCDQEALLKVTNSLAGTNFKHEAVDLLKGFSATCPNPAYNLAYAGNIEFELGSYEKALELSNQAIHQSPMYNTALYLRARALQKLSRNDEALKSYAELISKQTIQSSLIIDVFTNMALTYAAMGRYCEAASTIQTYIGFDPAERHTDTLEREISNYELLGACGSSFAGGESETLKIGNGAIIARVRVNDLPGNFILDTGATFVAVSPEFAIKAKLLKNDNYTIVSQTANGDAKSTLTVIDTIRLGRLSSKNVPALIQEKVLGHGIDGLLGLSFLSRFDLKSHGGIMTISGKDSSEGSSRNSRNQYQRPERLVTDRQHKHSRK